MGAPQDTPFNISQIHIQLLSKNKGFTQTIQETLTIRHHRTDAEVERTWSLDLVLDFDADLDLHRDATQRIPSKDSIYNILDPEQGFLLIPSHL